MDKFNHDAQHHQDFHGGSLLGGHDDAHTLATPPCRVAVVVGSTRANRICPDVASWLMRILQDRSRLNYGLIDLAWIDLPFLDEPEPPARGHYRHEHTRRWSQLVASFDGFVLVFPQYNWGYPAVLKNALDFLYREWSGKPVTYASYGSHGGDKAAAQMHTVLAGLKMRELTTHLELVVTDTDVDCKGQLRDTEAIFATYREQVRAIDVQMTQALAKR